MATTSSIQSELTNLTTRERLELQLGRITDTLERIQDDELRTEGTDVMTLASAIADIARALPHLPERLIPPGPALSAGTLTADELLELAEELERLGEWLTPGASHHHCGELRPPVSGSRLLQRAATLRMLAEVAPR